MRKLLLAALLALAMGCGGDGGSDNTPTLDGQWIGTVNTNGGAGELSLTLNEGNNGQVTGTGTLTVVGDAVALTVTGNYSPPNVSLQMTNPQFEPANLTGTVSKDQIKGTLNGSGLVSIAVTLDRQ
jgi:hypothetical protein